VFLISSVIKITPSGTVSTISKDVSFPVGIAVDHQGNLYVADQQILTTPSYGEVVKLTAH
jgi:DNA-binding beta-propeller fold protein YncE